MTGQIGIIILAAGSSSRLGTPKQLLMFRQQTLLDRIVGTCLLLNTGPVLVVLGSEKGLLSERWTHSKAIAVHNENWAQGISSSVKCGLQYLTDHFPSAEGAIFTVCDQPFITDSLLLQLIEKHRETQMPVVACSYDNVLGTPALFHHAVFGELMELTGDKGARQVINKDSSRLSTVPFPLGIRDIDTAGDYEQLLQNDEE